MRINYSQGFVAIPGYECGECGKTNVKLWRYRGVMVSCQELKCVVCASKLARIDHRTVNRLGLRRDSHGNTSRIGMMVPAVPSDIVGGKIDNYWSSSTLAGAGRSAMNWWRGLPLR